MTSETSDFETPARSATSRMVGRRPRTPLISGTARVRVWSPPDLGSSSSPISEPVITAHHSQEHPISRASDCSPTITLAPLRQMSHVSNLDRSNYLDRSKVTYHCIHVKRGETDCCPICD